jgi:hypothetical protein
MTKDKRTDIITEEEFDAEIARDASTDPQEDSPGDSESDSGAEFLMGLNFTPGEDTSFGDEDAELEGIENSGVEVPDGDLIPDEVIPKVIKKKIPSTALGVSSDLPSPWADRDESTSTH